MNESLSPSKLAMLARCGVQYEFVYVKGLRRPPDIARITGTAVDVSVNENLSHKIRTGETLHLDDVKEIAFSQVEKEIAGSGVELTEAEIEEGQTSVVGRAKDRAVSLAECHATAVAPIIEPAVVQRSWEIVVDSNDGEIAFRGRTDIEESTGAVRDTKTSGKTPSADAADISIQLTSYALAMAVDYGAAPKKVVLDTIVRGDSARAKPARAISLESQRSHGEFMVHLERIRQAARVLRSGVFLPTDPSNWWCSKTWCGFWNICPYAARRVSVVAPGQPEGGGKPSETGEAS